MVHACVFLAQVVGNVPELGSWLIDDGLVLSPTPGSSNLNMHSAVVQLPADMPVEAKVRGVMNYTT